MTIHRSFVLAATLVASTGLLAPRIADGQDYGEPRTRRIVVTPYAGMFVPATRIGELTSEAGGITTVMGMKQRSALALGLNASYWFNSLAGVEVGGAWAFSDASGSLGLSGAIPAFSLSGAESARVLFGSAKLMVNLLKVSERSALRLGVGPAVISRGGSAFKDDGETEFSGLTDFGGVISLCSRIPMTDFMSIRLRAENYMYSSNIRFTDAGNPAGDYEFGSKLQNDFIFSAGLQMVFWR